jgi:predicted small secreted protein
LEVHGVEVLPLMLGDYAYLIVGFYLIKNYKSKNFVKVDKNKFDYAMNVRKVN